MVLASSSSKHHLTGGEALHRSPTVPLTTVGPDKTEGSDFQNWIVQFSLFQIEAFGSCLVHVPTMSVEFCSSSRTCVCGCRRGWNTVDMANVIHLNWKFILLSTHKVGSNVTQCSLSLLTAPRQLSLTLSTTMFQQHPAVAYSI
jgi:hypothetical protein